VSDRKSANLPAAARAPQPSSRSELSRVITAARVPSAAARAAAVTVTITEEAVSSVEAIAAQLPDPATLPGGTLVIVPAEVSGSRSLARSVLAVFGRTKTVTRARRCSALLARGYVDIGAGDDANRADLAWAKTPSAASLEEEAADLA
jgi:hypothetical protein